MKPPLGIEFAAAGPGWSAGGAKSPANRNSQLSRRTLSGGYMRGATRTTSIGTKPKYLSAQASVATLTPPKRFESQSQRIVATCPQATQPANSRVALYTISTIGRFRG